MDEALRAKYEPVIGLEVHSQLLTRSKAFCGCSTAFGAAPNTNVCPICLGHPGTMPMLNENLVRFITMVGLAANCTIRPTSIFARKNYFYPDLPKGFQISQYETPICYDGWIECELPSGQFKKVGITRIHMEEDSGKSIHDFGAETLVDLNRAGVPLIEIVSEPDIRSSEEAYAYLTTIKSIVTYLGVCDGNMEEGSLRCDANISVRLKGANEFGQKTEIKNLNSFRNVQRAIDAEIERHIGILESGGKIVHETMLFDANKGTTRPMRSKEQAHDYRYFPEPDLLPVHITDEYIDGVRQQLPELQRTRRDRFIRDYSLSKYDADVITADKAVADFYEGVVANLPQDKIELRKQAANFIMGDIMRMMSEDKVSIDGLRVMPAHLAELISLVDEGIISNKIAKDILPDLRNAASSPKAIISERDLGQISDVDSLRDAVKKILSENPDNIAKYKAGKTNLFGFFVGQTMKATGGKANPTLLNELVKEELEKV